jgi:hypothetical protein
METNNELSKHDRIRNLLDITIQQSTIHGLPNFLKARNKTFKTIWLFSFLAAIASSFYLIKNNINNYLKYQVVTNLDLIYEQPIRFPTISFQFNYGFSNANYSLEENIFKLYYDNTEKLNISNEFEQIESTTGNIFFKFNSGKNIAGEKIDMKYQKTDGYLGGLSSQIFIGLPDDFQLEPNSIDSHNNYFSLYIHNNSINAVDSTDQPIKLSSGIKIYLL